MEIVKGLQGIPRRDTFRSLLLPSEIQCSTLSFSTLGSSPRRAETVTRSVLYPLNLNRVMLAEGCYEDTK